MDKEIFLNLLKERILILDGGMGTMVQGFKLTEKDYRGKQFADWMSDLKGNNDLLCITRPDVIKSIHRQYLDAGADIFATNTFNANAISMEDYGMQGQVRNINLAAGKLAREVADGFMKEHPDRTIFVAGSVGPTNKTASMSPDVSDPAYRAVTYLDLYSAYKEQVDALVDGGVDIVLFETTFDTLNVKAGLEAAEAVLKEKGKDLPIMLSLTLSAQGGRTFSGQTLLAFLASVQHTNIVSVGLNCSFGAADMKPFLAELAKHAPYYISAYPNAGLPNSFGSYDETPEKMAVHVKSFIDEGLVNILGGCCGTTPAHIAKYPELAEAQFLSNYAELRKSIHCIGDGAMSYRQHHLDAFTDDGASNITYENGVMRNNTPGTVFGGVFSQSKGEIFEAVWNYKTINIVNKFIATYKNSDNEGVLSTVGEAYFIRAYLYFEMVKRYGGVPLYSSPLDDVSSINNRSTEEKSWDYIKDNLDSALVLLPKVQRIASEDRDRANRYTALALKSRAMLYAGTIAKYGKVSNNSFQGIRKEMAKTYLLEAAKAAKEIVDDGKYALSTEFGDLFNGKDENNNEIIFRFANVAKTGVAVYEDYWYQSYRIKRAGYCAFMVPPLDVVEQFETLDGKIQPLDYAASKNNPEDFFANRDKRLDATVIYPGGEFLGERFSIYRKTLVKRTDGTTEEYSYEKSEDWMGAGKVPGHEKYMKSGADGIFLNLSAAGTTNWGFFLKKTLYGVKRLDDYLIQENDQDAVVIRYGEVILNLAEAAVELSTYGVNDYLTVAQVAFDQLRSIHGGLPAKTMDLEVVRHERRIDLMYEGFRYWDLKRWRIGEEKMHNKTLKALYPILHIDETTSPASVYYTLEKVEAPDLATRVKWFEERDYYCPLPLSKSPGIVQNDGWN